MEPRGRGAARQAPLPARRRHLQPRHPLHHRPPHRHRLQPRGGRARQRHQPRVERGHALRGRCSCPSRSARGRHRFLASYTLAKAENYANDDQIPFASGPIDPNDLRARVRGEPERSASPLHLRRHLRAARGLPGLAPSHPVHRGADGHPHARREQSRVPDLGAQCRGPPFQTAADLNRYLTRLNASGGMNGVPLPLVSDDARFSDSFRSFDLRVSKVFGVGRSAVARGDGRGLQPVQHHERPRRLHPQLLRLRQRAGPRLARIRQPRLPDLVELRPGRSPPRAASSAPAARAPSSSGCGSSSDRDRLQRRPLPARSLGLVAGDLPHRRGRSSASGSSSPRRRWRRGSAPRASSTRCGCSRASWP